MNLLSTPNNHLRNYNQVVKDIEILEEVLIGIKEGASDEKRMAINSLEKLLAEKRLILETFEKEMAPKYV